MKDLVVIYNTAPRYRESIFKALDSFYWCDWYYGNDPSDVKQMDNSILERATVMKRVGERPYWLKGGWRLAFREDAGAYMMLGEIGFLTPWAVSILTKVFHPDRMIYYWSHGWYGRENRLKKALKKLQFSFADKVFLYGEYARTEMIAEGFKPEKLAVVHNSLHYDAQKRLRDKSRCPLYYQEHFGNADPVLIFLGRLTFEKRLDMLIRSAGMMKERGRQLNLVLVGSGEAMDSLKALASELGISSRIWFFGECYDEEKNGILVYNADVCVSPGNVGLSAIHSMTFGTPVITHDNKPYQGPEFESIKEGKTGSFFKYGDLSSLCDCMERWLDCNGDREAVRQACYSEVDNYWTPGFQMDVFKKYIENVDRK